MTKQEALRIQSEQVEWYGRTRPSLAYLVAANTTADQLEDDKLYDLFTINKHIPRGGHIEGLISHGFIYC